MQEIRSSNPHVVTGICDPNKSRAQNHRSLRLGSKLKYLKMIKASSLSFYVETLTKTANFAHCPSSERHMNKYARVYK